MVFGTYRHTKSQKNDTFKFEIKTCLVTFSFTKVKKKIVLSLVILCHFCQLKSKTSKKFPSLCSNPFASFHQKNKFRSYNKINP